MSKIEKPKVWTRLNKAINKTRENSFNIRLKMTNDLITN
jgi:hypothetical protein